MNMSLKMDDVIYVHGFKSEYPDFYCYKHFIDLVGLPTRVFLIRNGEIYVTHPTLDVVPLSENCVDYEVLEDVDVGYHRQLKDKLQMLKTHGVKKIPKERLTKIFKPKLKEQEEPKKSSRDEVILDLVDKFNNNELDLDFLNSFVGGLENFINILSKKGWLHLINPFATGAQDMQNSLFYAFYLNNRNFIWNIVDNFLSDVTKIDGEYYLDIEPSDLAGFFRTGRSDISEDAIASIISGEHNLDFWDVTNDEYGDVYENLKPEHKNTVDDRVRSELGNYETLLIGYRTPELFDEIAEEQGTEGKINIDDSVINRLISDEQSMRYLINQELDDVRRELYSLYSMCYQDALQDEWYDSIMSELEGYVIDDRKFDDYTYKKETWDKNGNRITKTMYGKRYKATKCIYNIVTEWLDDNKDKDGYNSNTIEYFGSLEGVLKDLVDYGSREQLRVPRLDDYPDYRKVQRCINENFTSYF